MFDSLPEREISKDTLLHTLKTMKAQWRVSFQFKASDYSDRGWTNLLHLTIGANSGHYGDRNPAIFFKAGHGMMVSSAVSGKHDYNKYITDDRPSLNTWTWIKISQELIQGKSTYVIKLNDKLVHSVVNTQPQEFNNVKVFGSDPWHKAQPGSIKDFTIVMPLATGSPLSYYIWSWSWS